MAPFVQSTRRRYNAFSRACLHSSVLLLPVNILPPRNAANATIAERSFNTHQLNFGALSTHLGAVSIYVNIHDTFRRICISLVKMLSKKILVARIVLFPAMQTARFVAILVPEISALALCYIR